MGKVSYMTWVGLLAVLMAGCGSGDGASQQDAASTPAAAPATTQAAAKTPSSPEPELAPIVDPLPSAPDLIQSTNAGQRISELEQEQSSGQQKDPFNIVSLPPIVELPEEDPPEVPRTNPIDRTRIRQLPGVPRTTQSSRGVGGGAIARGNSGAQVEQPAVEVTPAVEPITFPSLPQMEPMPAIGQLPIAVVVPAAPPPPPEIATAVIVSGVMELGGQRAAIVTVPNEPSRNVKVGDRLANRAVLVKRIEISRFDKPVVILEENGYEVARALGDKPSSAEQP